jgi:hypothetical protein
VSCLGLQRRLKRSGVIAACLGAAELFRGARTSGPIAKASPSWFQPTNLPVPFG